MHILKITWCITLDPEGEGKGIIRPLSVYLCMFVKQLYKSDLGHILYTTQGMIQPWLSPLKR